MITKRICKNCYFKRNFVFSFIIKCIYGSEHHLSFGYSTCTLHEIEEEASAEDYDEFLKIRKKTNKQLGVIK